MNHIGVKIEYKNKDLKTVCERTYDLREYTDMLRQDMLYMISDVENLLYKVNQNKPKSEWSEESTSSFLCLKHKLLDKAGEIGRLPDNQVPLEDGSDLRQFVATIFGSAGNGTSKME